MIEPCVLDHALLGLDLLEVLAKLSLRLDIDLDQEEEEEEEEDREKETNKKQGNIQIKKEERRMKKEEQ